MIYQWVYSYSCWNRQKRPTDVRSRGFGTFSWTEGLSIEDIDELERRCSGYNFPNDYNIPARPTQEEIDEYLPVAFYSFTLASGRRAIVRTRYVGEGFYDKRWGAIISHGLILDEGDWPTYVMEYFDSPVFWNELPAATRKEAVQYKDRPDAPQPPYLPALELSDLQMTGKYSPEHVARRLDEHVEFSRMLSSLIHGFMSTDTGTEPLCISAPTNDIPWLFAGLMMAFPVEISDDFSFCTYLSDKMPAESEVGRWYRVAAVEKRSCFLDLESSGEDHDKWYVDTLFKTRKPFMEFLQDFSALGFGDLPCAVMLYRYLKENGELKNEDFSRSLKLLLEHGNEDVRREFIEALVAGRCLPEQITDAWFTSVFSLAADYDELRPTCYDLFLQHRKNYEGDELAFFVRMADRYPKEITVRWLEENASSDLSTMGLLFTFASLQKNGYAHELGDGPWESLFKGAATAADWAKILDKVVSDFPDCMIPVINNCPDVQAKDCAINKICADADKTIGFAERLITAGQHKLAADAIRKFLEQRSADKIASLRRICESLEKSNENFAHAEYSHMFASLHLTDVTIGKDDFGWLLSKIGWIEVSEQEKYLKSIAPRLVFPQSRDPEYRSLLSNFLQTKHGLLFRSGRVGLIEWFLGLLVDGVTYETASAAIDGLETRRDAVSNITTGEQLFVCEQVVMLMVDKTENDSFEKSVTQQSKILSFIDVIVDEQALEKIAARYVSVVTHGMRRGKISYAEERMLALIKCAIGNKCNRLMSKALLGALSSGVLRKLDESDLNHVKQKLGTLTAGEKDRWDDVCDRVSEGHTFLAKVKSVTGFLFKRK